MRLYSNLFRLAHTSYLKRMVSSYVNQKQEPDLFQHEVLVTTKQGNDVKVNCVFMDTKPSGSDKPVLFGVHGSPGSHRDYKYIFPNVERFVGINWPACGYTSYDHSLLDDNEERIQIVQKIVDELNLKNIIFIGHSRGSECALKMAALNQDKCLATILLNPICLQPHKGVRPFAVVSFLAWLWKTFPFMHPIFNPVLYWGYNKFGLRVHDGLSAGVNLNLIRNADFESQHEYIEKLNSGTVKVLNLYAGNDFLVEPQLPDELANHFNDNQTITCSGEDDSEVLSEVKEKLQSGVRHISICFEKDGHFLQKTRADFVSKCVQFLSEANNNQN